MCYVLQLTCLVYASTLYIHVYKGSCTSYRLSLYFSPFSMSYPFSESFLLSPLYLPPSFSLSSSLPYLPSTVSLTLYFPLLSTSYPLSESLFTLPLYLLTSLSLSSPPPSLPLTLSLSLTFYFPPLSTSYPLSLPSSLPCLPPTVLSHSLLPSCPLSHSLLPSPLYLSSSFFPSNQIS